MITGIGFSELLLILALVLLFFGSKELPQFIRHTATFMAKVRGYSDRMRRELDEIANPPAPSHYKVSVLEKKKELRARYSAARKALDDQERVRQSRAICEQIKGTDHYQKARAVMLYAHYGNEVQTHELIRDALAGGKRVVLPYCTGAHELRLGEITDFDLHLTSGTYGILEPVEERRDNFFKSDLQLVLCPGVAFDRFGARLGHGKRYYDTFLSELKGKTPIYGLAFDCQIHDESLPFEYHDVPMDQIFTQSGPLMGSA